MPMTASKKHSAKHAVKLSATAVLAGGLAGGAAVNSTQGSFPMVMDGCGMEGNATKSQWQWDANPLKNRYVAPDPAEIDPTTTFQSMAGATDIKGATDPTTQKDLPIPVQARGAEIEGYIWYVKPGGTESCNCGATTAPDMDTHIYVCDTPYPAAMPTGSARSDLEKRSIIVEVTPRVRQRMSQNGIDWSTTGLQTAFQGHPVRISGWLFYDKEHSGFAQVNTPGNVKDWRGSCWEVHPVTDIQLLDSTHGATAGVKAMKQVAHASPVNDTKKEHGTPKPPKATPKTTKGATHAPTG